MTFFQSRKRTSSLALAISLATGFAVTATAVYPTEASAQRRNRDKKKDENDGGGYSEEFLAAYTPLNEALNAEGADVAALRPQIDALVPLMKTNDEKNAGGGLLFNAAVGLSDHALQLQGMELMLGSGLTAPERLPQFNFIAYQLSSATNDFTKARHYLQQAIDLNYTSNTVTASDLQILMAENFFSAEQFNEGYAFLKDAIEKREAQNLPVEENWYRRGVTLAYNNESIPQVYEFTSMWISNYPSATNWRDAVNITRNLNSFEAAEILDLFRLGRRVDALRDASDYDYYVEAADARRLPKEVKDVIDEGRAAGVVNSGNLFLTEALETANGRIASDRSDLPALERDASAASAGLRTVIAAGDAFLSYGEFAKAATFYEKAAGIAGADTALINTRLGIAQVELGQFDAARTSFAKVQGARQPIAQLWSVYATQLEGEANPAPAASPAPAPEPAPEPAPAQ